MVDIVVNHFISDFSKRSIAMNVSGSSMFTSIYRQHLLNPDLRPQKPTDTEQKPENKPSVDGSVRPDGTEKPNNTSSLPDKVFAEIQELAKKDAKKENFMDADTYGAYLKKYQIQNHISPDRGQLMTMFKSMVQTTPSISGGEPTFIQNIPGFPSYSAKFTPTAPIGGKLSVYDQSGNEILSYDPARKDGWKETPTQKEIDFKKEADRVYKEAYEAARKEAAENKPTPKLDINLSV